MRFFQALASGTLRCSSQAPAPRSRPPPHEAATRRSGRQRHPAARPGPSAGARERHRAECGDARPRRPAAFRGRARARAESQLGGRHLAAALLPDSRHRRARAVRRRAEPLRGFPRSTTSISAASAWRRRCSMCRRSKCCAGRRARGSARTRWPGSSRFAARIRRRRRRCAIEATRRGLRHGLRRPHRHRARWRACDSAWRLVRAEIPQRWLSRRRVPRIARTRTIATS